MHIPEWLSNKLVNTHSTQTKLVLLQHRLLLRQLRELCPEILALLRRDLCSGREGCYLVPDFLKKDGKFVEVEGVVCV